MMGIGIVIFLIGLYLVFDYKKYGINSSCFCKSEDRAMDTLRERYARGEITSEEFITMKNTLSE